MTRLIGLTGRKRSGKNTAGDVFMDLGYTQMSFAAPIKIMVAALLAHQGLTPPVIRRMLDGDLKEVESPFLGGRSPRYAMQTLGTEWGRNLMKDSLWVDTLLNGAQRFPAVVVTDVRFPNEVDAIKSAGGKIYRINRPGLTANDNHPSETFIDELEVDQDLHNEASSAEQFQSYVYDAFAAPVAGVS